MTLHLVVTTLCIRNCKYCCNNNYNLQNLEYASDDDFINADMLCLTGGEPFLYANPCNLAKRYRRTYPNLKFITVYSNAVELRAYLSQGGTIHDIDGINISVKNLDDVEALKVLYYTPQIRLLPMNRIYDFTGKVPESFSFGEVINREWQENFVPAPDCVFKRGN